MSALTNLRDLPTSDLAAIIDAAYPGDPAGTPANAAYFIANVHNYLKLLGQITLPGKTFFVSPQYTDISSPYFPTIAQAYADVSGSSSSNKQIIEVLATPSSYSDILTLSSSQWVMFKGRKYTTPISGAVSITNGVSIFKEITFQSDIAVSGGVAIFEDCSQIPGSFTMTGGTVIITKCDTWGFISILNNSMTLFLEGIKYVKKGTGSDSNNSITINPGITIGDFAFSDLTLEGLLSNGSSVTIQESNIRENGIARPAY